MTTTITPQQVAQHNKTVIARIVAQHIWAKTSRMSTSTRHATWNRQAWVRSYIRGWMHVVMHRHWLEINLQVELVTYGLKAMYGQASRVGRQIVLNEAVPPTVGGRGCRGAAPHLSPPHTKGYPRTPRTPRFFQRAGLTPLYTPIQDITLHDDRGHPQLYMLVGYGILWTNINPAY